MLVGRGMNRKTGRKEIPGRRDRGDMLPERWLQDNSVVRASNAIFAGWRRNHQKVPNRVHRECNSWHYFCFFLRFMYSSTSVTDCRWSSALESTVSIALPSTNSYCLASAASVLAASLSARSFD